MGELIALFLYAAYHEQHKLSLHILPSILKKKKIGEEISKTKITDSRQQTAIHFFYRNHKFERYFQQLIAARITFLEK